MTAGTAGASGIRLGATLFAALSLAAVLAGCWAAHAHGAPPQSQILNLAAWLGGGLLASGIARGRWRVSGLFLALAPGVLLFTLVSEGLLGVHRWVAIGPLRVNAAELLLPAALVACAALGPQSFGRLVLPPLLAALLAAQPDLSQAAATGAAALVPLVTSTRPPGARLLSGLCVLAGLAVAALRPDPVGPVPEVEGIVRLAADISPGLAALGVAAILGAALAPLALAHKAPPPLRDPALALTAYLAVAAFAPVLGPFPVPWMGMAISPILGTWLGFGLLAQLGGRPDFGDSVPNSGLTPTRRSNLAN